MKTLSGDELSQRRWTDAGLRPMLNSFLGARHFLYCINTVRPFLNPDNSGFDMVLNYRVSNETWRKNTTWRSSLIFKLLAIFIRKPNFRRQIPEFIFNHKIPFSPGISPAFFGILILRVSLVILKAQKSYVDHILWLLSKESYM